jgi:lipoprotein-anchoring transpeptidase ErfK/SrfK
MASPPEQRRVRPALPAAVTPKRLGVAAILGLTGLGLLAAWTIPAAASSESRVGTSAVSSPTSGSTDDSTAAVAVPKHKKPVAATRTTKAKHVPNFPRDRAHYGKRIVYDKALMTVWLIDKHNQVVARYPVVGRFDRPAKGTYHVFSKSPKAYNPNSKVTFNWMNRFTYGPDTKSAIGFHAIPRYYSGKPMHSTRQLGLAIARGGCVRLSEEAAKVVYDFLKVGDLVVVLPSP